MRTALVVAALAALCAVVAAAAVVAMNVGIDVKTPW